MKLLVVDDEPVSRLVLEKQLSKAGHHVVSADNGRAALEILERQPSIQIVLSDWIMPEVDGLGLCRAVRAMPLPRYIYVMLVTVMGSRQNYLEALEAGADDFITKPVDAEELAARLRVAERVLGLQDEVKRLRGLLAICSYCKRIRDDDGQWVSVERYVSSRSEASFTHSICPVCYKGRVVPEIEAQAKKGR